MTKQSVLEQAKELPKQEQIEIAIELWDIVTGAGLNESLAPEMQAELDRRILEDDQDTLPGQDWATLRAQLLRGEI